MTSKMCCSFTSQSPPVILDYKANQDELNSKTLVTYEVGHLIVNQNRRHKKKKCSKEVGTSCHGPANLTRNIIMFQGFAFHANRFSKPGSSLLMVLPIKLEAHPNTNISQYFGFVTSNPRLFLAWQLQQCAFPSWN